MFAPVLIALLAPIVQLDVPYCTVGGETLSLDVYRPANAKRLTGAAILVHGGAWVSGSRREMKGLATSLANEGVAAFAIQYRLAPKVHWPAMLDDARTAVRYVRAHAADYRVDKARIGAAGVSAGGQIALMLGLTEAKVGNNQQFARQSSRVRAVLDMFGPTDMSLFAETPVNDFLAEMILGKKRSQAEQEMRNASPIEFVKPDAASIFIIQGLADELVDPDHSRMLEQKCKANSVPVTARYIEGMGHSLSQTVPGVKAAYREGIAWLIRQLAN